MEQAETDKDEAAEVGPEQKLAATGKRLLITVVFCCIGWPVFLYAYNYSINPLIMFIGGAIVSAPILFVMAKGGTLKDIFKTDEYEIITTYSDGRKSSDFGAQSLVIGFIIKIFMFFLIIFLGCIITPGLLLFLFFMYSILYLQVSEKPSFIRSAFPAMIAALLIFIVSGLVVNGMVNARARASDHNPSELGRRDKVSIVYNHPQ